MNLSRYPIVYSVLIIPLSVVRWVGFAKEAKSGTNPTPAEYHLAALAVFGLSGFLNTILLLTTKPRSGLFGTLMRTTKPRSPPAADSPQESA